MKDELILKIPMLRSVYKGLTKSERRIADYVANNTAKVMEQTVSEIAANTNSSDITVSRFCKKLGCSGLQELKLYLTAELSSVDTKEYHDICKHDTCQTVGDKIFQNISEGLQDTQSILDYDGVDRAADILRKARRIALYGFGNSGTVCRDMEIRFLRLGLVVQAYTDSHMQVTSAALLSEKDVVIAISHSGASVELLQSVNTAQKNGAKIIAITSHGQSPLAKISHICLCAMGREVKYSSEASASRLIHMAVGDILYTRIAMADTKQFDDNINKMRAEILKKRSLN